jgi:Domain of unknown function (DUF1802)
MKDSSISATTSICLPSPDVEALLQGRSIFAISRSFISSANRQFAVSPIDGLLSNLPIEATYKPTFIHSAIEATENYSHKSDPLLLSVLESSQIITSSEEFDNLYENSVWTKEFLQAILSERGRIFLNKLRVYKAESSRGFHEKISSSKLGGFIKLQKGVTVRLEDAILTDFQFSQKKIQFQESRKSLFPDLEALQSTIALYTQANPVARDFENDLRVFLGWSHLQNVSMSASIWTDETITITEAGNSSDGYLFEKLVRQAFIYLGFTNNLNNPKASLDPNGMGGAGGIDVYCEKPFPIVGECKASGLGNVGNGVCAQLINLGNTNLGKDRFEAAVKIIFAAGKLNTTHAEPAAKENKMNVMRPDTLQRLVELKIANPGSIDLMELEPCLRREPFGSDSDKKVNDFIDEIEKKLQVRSHVVQSVKSLKEGGDSPVSASTVRTHFNVAFAPTLQEPLDTLEQAHSILIELSSPLTGYLGRTKGDNWKADRFYFLRDLIV